MQARGFASRSLKWAGLYRWGFPYRSLFDFGAALCAVGFNMCLHERMGVERVQLHREQETMLMTLYLHKLDAESESPVLDDRFAKHVLDQIDYDFDRLKRLRGNQPMIIARAKLIDDHVRDYLKQKPDAVVLHLGCGLDSRILRVDPAPDTTWIEVDQQPVIDLRRQFYPDRDGVTTIAGSATDPAWWADVAAGRPLLVVGEGLLMYLPPEGVRAVCDNVARSGPSDTTLIFDTVAPWVCRIAGWQPNMRRAATGFQSSTRDLDKALRPYRSMTLQISTSLVTEAARRTKGVLAAFIKLVDAVPAGHRAMYLQSYQPTAKPSSGEVDR